MRKNVILAVILALALGACASKKPIAGIEKLNQPSVASYAPEKVAFDGKLQVIAFNIEQGPYWKDVVKYVDGKKSEIPATIVLVSEADRMHSRSGDIFVADVMAKALKMNMVYATEFIEYNDKTKDTPGETGNAILSAFPLENITVIRQVDLFSWTRWGFLQGQPRKGDEVAIGATALLPTGKRVRVYEVHFENYATSSGRARQMEQVLEDAKKYDLPVVIGGDYNELPGGQIFKAAKKEGFENTFAGNNQPTGACVALAGKLLCLIKIDWQVVKGLTVRDKTVDYPLASNRRNISDHAPVRVIYSMP